MFDIPNAQIYFSTSDQLLLWLLDHKVEGVEVVSHDLPIVLGGKIGFATEKTWALIGLAHVKANPPSLEVLKKFRPIPRVFGQNPMITTYGRRWLATGENPYNRGSK